MYNLIIMRTIDRTVIKESIEELKDLQKKVSHRRFVLRIQMLIFLKEYPRKPLKEIAKILHLHYDTLKKWWKKYKEGGLEGLLEWKVKGYPGKMKEEQLKEFEKELNEKGFRSQKEMMKWIYERFGIKYCQQGISNLMKRIGAKKKVGRRVNVKKDEKKEKEFKEKRFKEIARENPDKEIFFMTNRDSD